MSNENPNNSFHWKSKLEGLEYLPGETFNKDIAWDKLYERLRGKQGNKKTLWYWIAAASLLFVLVITLVSYYKDNPKLSHKEIVIKKSTQKSVHTPFNVDINNDKNINPVQPAKDRNIVVKGKFYKKIYHVSSAELVSKAHMNDTSSIYLQNAVIKSLPKIDITPGMATALPEKKKLNVVHINELGDPVTEFPNVVRKTDKHFTIKLADEEVFAAPSVASKTTGFSILKTKLSSN